MLLPTIDAQSRLERRIGKLDASIASLDASLDPLVAGTAPADTVRSRIQELSIERQRAHAQLEQLRRSTKGASVGVIVPTKW